MNAQTTSESGVILRAFAWLWCLALLAVFALGGACLYFGDLNQDEGWYLYAARLVARGQWPLLDFASTQPPVLPFVYALGDGVVVRWGLAGGRAITLALGLAALLLTAVLAGRLAGGGVSGRVAALGAFMLAGLNVFQLYFFTIVKTYALSALLLAGGFLLLSVAYARSARWAPFGAGVLLLLAAGTRFSALFALGGVVLAWLPAACRSSVGRRALVWFLAGVLAAGLVVFLPLALRAPQALWFALVEYHAGRESGGWLQQCVWKGGFVVRLLRAYGVVATLAAGVVALVWWRRRRAVGGALEERGRAGGDVGPLRPAMLWWAVGLVSAVHLAAPFPYDDYQVMVMPLVVAGLAAAVVRVLVWDRRQWCWGLGVLLVVSMIGVGASPVLEGWFIGPRDRIWWPVKAASPLAVLRVTARELVREEGLKPGDLLLTQDPYLAVEAGLELPAGLALGPFSYFPEWSRERAEARHVVNREMLEALIRSGAAPVAAFSGYGLALQLPEVRPLPAAQAAALWRLVETHYVPVKRVAPFGQADTELVILRRRGSAGGRGGGEGPIANTE